MVLPLATLSLLWWTWRTGRLRVSDAFRRGWALWVLVAITLASAAWSIDAEGSLLRGVRFFGEALLGMGLLAYLEDLEDAWRRPALLALSLGLGGAAAFALIDATSGFVLPVWLGREPHDERFVVEPRLFYTWGAVVLAVLLLPVATILARAWGRVAGALLALLGIATILALASLTAKVSLVAAVAAGACLLVWTWCRWILGAGALALLVALPVAFPVSPATVCNAFQVGASAAHRLMIYNAADARIAQRPVLGWGVNTSSEVLAAPQLTRWPACEGVRLKANEQLQTPRHPHNLPLQIRLELGLPGSVAAGLLLLVILRALRRSAADRLTVAAAWGALVAAVVTSLVGFGMWQGWLIAFYFLAAAVVKLSLAVSSPRVTPPPPVDMMRAEEGGRPAGTATGGTTRRIELLARRHSLSTLLREWVTSRAKFGRVAAGGPIN